MTKLQNNKLEYATNHIRDFIHVDDVVKAIMLLKDRLNKTMDINMPVEASCMPTEYDIGTGKGLVVSDLAKMINPNITETGELLAARLSAVVAVCVAGYFGINPPSSFVAKTVAFAFGLAASSFFPTLIMGIFSKRVNKEGAIAGMICGIGFTLGYIVYFQFLTDTKEYWLGISPEGIGFVGMFASIYYNQFIFI